MATSSLFLFILLALFCPTVYTDTGHPHDRLRTHSSRSVHEYTAAHRLFNRLQNEYNEMYDADIDEISFKSFRPAKVNKWAYKQWSKVTQRWFDYKMHFVEQLLTIYLDGSRKDLDDIFGRRLHHFISVIMLQRPQEPQTQEEHPKPAQQVTEETDRPKPSWLRRWWRKPETSTQTQQQTEHESAEVEALRPVENQVQTHRRNFFDWLKKIALQFVHTIKEVTENAKEIVASFIREIICKVARWVYEHFIGFYQKAIVAGYNHAKLNMANNASVTFKEFKYKFEYDLTHLSEEPVVEEKSRRIVARLRKWWRKKAFSGAVKVANVAFDMVEKSVDKSVNKSVTEFLDTAKGTGALQHMTYNIKVWIKQILAQFFLHFVPVGKDIAVAVYEHLKRALAEGAAIEYHEWEGRVRAGEKRAGHLGDKALCGPWEGHPPPRDHMPHGHPPKDGRPPPHHGPHPPPPPAGGGHAAMSAYDDAYILY